MTMYSWLGKQPVAVDIVTRRQSGLEILWQELKWDSFFQAVELQ